MNIYYRKGQTNTRLQFARALVLDGALGRAHNRDADAKYDEYVDEVGATGATTRSSRRIQSSKFRQFIKLGNCRPNDALIIFEEAFDVAKKFGGCAFDLVLKIVRQQLRKQMKLTRFEMECICNS